MKKLFAAALLATSFIPALARAQDTLTPAAFEKILTEDLKRTFVKKAGKTSVDYEIKDSPYHVFFSNGASKYLLFSAEMNTPGADLKKVNEWNQGAIYSRVTLNGNKALLEVPLGIVPGVTKDLVKRYYNEFEGEYGNFKLFIEKK